MYDIKALENEWERYNKKKRLPLYVGIFLGLLFLVGVVTTIYYNTFSNKDIDRVENRSFTKEEFNISKKVLDDRVVTKNSADKSLIKTEQPIEKIVDNIPILDESGDIKEEVKNNRPRKKIDLNIIESSNIEAYNDVEKRFFATKNVDDSLFLAKAYYNMGKYKKSEFWALQTNKINSSIDESWIIFAKSKVKLGHKNEAINILQNYIKRTSSNLAKNSLLEIQTSK
jgi:tetratricopeptide (TPR) repeat protein